MVISWVWPLPRIPDLLVGNPELTFNLPLASWEGAIPKFWTLYVEVKFGHYICHQVTLGPIHRYAAMPWRQCHESWKYHWKIELFGKPLRRCSNLRYWVVSGFHVRNLVVGWVLGAVGCEKAKMVVHQAGLWVAKRDSFFQTERRIFEEVSMIWKEVK